MQVNQHLNNQNTCFTARLYNDNTTFKLMRRYAIDSGLKDEFKSLKNKLRAFDKKDIYLSGRSNKKPYPCVRMSIQLKECGKPLKKSYEHIDSTTTNIGEAAYKTLKQLTDNSSEIFKKVF